MIGSSGSRIGSAGAFASQASSGAVIRPNRVGGMGGSMPPVVVGTSIAAQTSVAIQDLWYKNAVVYCLDVETYMDGNGDGVGDFGGLTARIPYLAQLGVSCLWLLPFHPSPNRDDGYDISDYYGIDPRLGTLGDFVEFIRTADAHGL